MNIVEGKVGQFIALTWYPALAIAFRINILRRAINEISPQIRSLWLFFIIALTASAIAGDKAIESSIYVLILIMTGLTGILVWRSHQGGILISLKIYSILFICLILILIALNITSAHEKFASLRNPNGFSFLLLSTIPGLLIIKKTSIKVLLISLIFYFVVQTGSRSGLFSIMIVLFSYWYIKNRISFSRAGVRVAAIFIVINLILPNEITDTVLSDLVAVDDDYRGVGTGFTGRTAAWGRSLEVWSLHPVFGVGFKASPHYFSNYVATVGEGTYGYELPGSHNGYLSLLMETGIICFMLGSVAIFKSIKIMIKRAQNVLAFSVFVPFSFACLFVAIFEDFLLSFGNPSSIVFIAFCLCAPAIEYKKNVGTLSRQGARVTSAMD